MFLYRRQFLRLLGLGATAASWPGPYAGAQGRSASLMIVLADLPADLSAERFRAVLDPFVRADLPVGLVLDPGSRGPLPGRPGADFRGGLRDAMMQWPNLLEPIPLSEPLAAARPYFQMRLASQAVSRFRDWLGPPEPLTIASRASDAQAPLDGVRVAGLRNVLLLPERAAPSRIAPCGNGIFCGSGGLPVSLDAPGHALGAALEAASAENGTATLIVSLASTAGANAETLTAQATGLVDRIAVFRDQNRATSLLPREMVLRNDPGFTRLLALHLVAPPDGDAAAAAAFDEFAAMLRQAGLGFSVTPTGAPAALTPWLQLAQGPGAFHGLDGDGRRHLAADITFDGQDDPVARLTRDDAIRDMIVTIAPGAYASRASRNALIAAIGDTAARPVTRLAGLEDFAARTRPTDPVFDLMRATRDSKAAAAPVRVATDADERAALIADARLAWSYFDRTSHPRTGLCPSTAEISANEISSFPYLTMWDYGSQILATLSAHEIGLIDNADFQARSAGLIRGLRAARIGGLALPRSEIRINAPDQGTSEFNACDTGRLMVALRALRSVLPDSAGVDAAVAQWDLGKVVVDARLHSHDGTGFIPFYASHCGSYAARGFGLWGHDVLSPHDAMQGQTETDAQMSLLYTIENFGVLCAEPLLMEAVELSPNRAVAYLSDMLFAAQLRSFVETGKLFCLSEGPLPRPPWFSYQGLRVGQADPRWDLVTIEKTPEFQSEQFRADNLVVSSKAAFLWAATRPHSYSSRLLDHVRERAIIPGFGFAAGIYQKTGKPTENYTDINTNGVILQSIAHVLRGRKPRPMQ